MNEGWGTMKKYRVRKSCDLLEVLLTHIAVLPLMV